MTWVTGFPWLLQEAGYWWVPSVRLVCWHQWRQSLLLLMQHLMRCRSHQSSCMLNRLSLASLAAPLHGNCGYSIQKHRYHVFSHWSRASWLVTASQQAARLLQRRPAGRRRPVQHRERRVLQPSHIKPHSRPASIPARRDSHSIQTPNPISPHDTNK